METLARTVVLALVLLTLALSEPPPARAAILAVTDCGDSGGPNQLRQVIAAASSGDTINIGACTITLTVASPMIINKSLTINGAGAQQTIIDGGGITQIFNISTGAVAISDVTLQNAFAGSVGGAAFVGSGSLTVKDSLVTHNHAKGSGGIQNQGTLTLIDSTVSGNTASSSNAGGIGSFGNTTLINTTVSGNTGPRGGIITPSRSRCW